MTSAIRDLRKLWSPANAAEPQERDNATWRGQVAQTEAEALRWRGRPIDLILFGDSIVHGWTQPKMGRVAWAESLQEHAIALGVPGDETQHMLARIHRGVLKGLEPKTILLVVGANHVLRPNAADEFVSGVTAVHEAVRHDLPTVSMRLLLVPHGWALDVIDSFAAEADRLPIPLVYPRAAFVDARTGAVQRGLLRDDIHPTPEGYSRLTHAVSSAVGIPTRSKPLQSIWYRATDDVARIFARINRPK